MNKHGQKFPEYKRINAAGSFPKQLSKSTVQFADNRPAAAMQKNLLQAMNNSERVQQLKAYPAITNNNTVQPKVTVNDSPALEHEADVMGRKSLQQSNTVNAQPLSTGNKSSAGEGIIQGVWVRIDGASVKSNMRAGSGGTFTYSATGKTYKRAGKESDGTIIVKPVKLYKTKKSKTSISTTPQIPGATKKIAKNSSSGHRMAELGTWTKNSQGVKPRTKWGTVSATHKRGAPKLGSLQKDYGNFKMSDKYVDYITALRSGGQADSVIAQGLLDEDDTVLNTHGEKRGAAMMHATVNLAEEWRKHGASKTYRAELRLVADGTWTFDEFLKNFKFIKSADEGRKQVGRFHEVHHGNTDEQTLSSTEKTIWRAMSPTRDEDFSSDDDERERKEDAVKKKRIFYTPHAKNNSNQDSDDDMSS